MTRFYEVHDKHKLVPLPFLDHQACVSLSCYAPAMTLFSTDIERWRDQAKHGSVLELRSNLHLLCLDMEELIEKGKNELDS